MYIFNYQLVFPQVSVKNLQCIGTLLEVVDCHGNVLDTAWPLLLNALQVILLFYSENDHKFAVDILCSDQYIELSSVCLINVVSLSI